MSKDRALNSRIINHLVESGLIRPNDKIVVSVSGGMDSMLLLYMLIELQKKWGIELVIGHVNHNIRPNSINDERFVIEQGKKLGIPVMVKQLNCDDKKSGESTEAWARKNRYAQLELIRKEYNFDKIATGHHSNDQIETILQRISEKSGIGGLKGIHKQYNTVIRPLLTISKSEIEKVVNVLQIKYVEDETNSNLDIPRNYFRHQIIPKWEMLYPNLGESIQSICDSAAENQSVIDYFVEELENKIVIEEKDLSSNNIIKKINVSSFEKLQETVKVLLIKHILGKYPWRKYQWNEITQILKSAKIGKVYNFDDFEILKDRQDWIIRHKLKVNLKPIIARLNTAVPCGKLVFNIREVKKYTITDSKNVEIIDGESIINKKLILRPWREGDVFQPLGMKGKKKISDFLTDEKVNQFDKENQLVLIANNEIIWLCGRRLSETVKINRDTKDYLELSMKTRIA
ncbi:tRNA lysidine(34) synthetase TilS [bacterium]|nr:tRNA lysidine(34) synthetase TilS [bacterium]